MTQRQPIRLVGLSGRESRASRAFAGTTNIQRLGVGVDDPDTAVDIDGHLTMSMQPEPPDPGVDKATIWIADGELPPFNKGDIVAKLKQLVDGQEQVKDILITTVTAETVLLTDEYGNYVVCDPLDASDPSAFIRADYEGGDP